jgi:hypothetical protein
MLTRQAKPFGTGSPCKQNHLIMLTRQAKPFGTGSPCKQNHLIMLTGKQNHLEQAHPKNRTN